MRDRRSLRLLWALLLVGVGAVVHPVPAAAQDTAETGTSRPDSLRAAVLERIRAPEPPEAEAPEAEEEADPTEEPEPGPGPEEGALPVAPQIVPQPAQAGAGTARARPRAELPAQADSIMQALIELEGYTPASYEGARADFTALDRNLVLWGTEGTPARFSGEGVRVEADSSITYQDREGRVRTTGPTVLTSGEGEPVRSRSLVYDVREERATARDAETTYTEGAQWFVRGDLDSVQQGMLFGSEARFTSCDLDPPHSHFQANSLKVIADRVLVARSVRMYVEDVPVLWLPFIAQNLESGRSSGILTPTFSVNDVVRTSTGYNRRISNVGYYWAMSAYSDLTVAMDWHSDNYTAVQGDLQYRWARQFLDGRVNVKRYWRDTGRQELAFDTRHNWEASERTRLRASGRFVSSSDFVRSNSFDPREINQTVNSDASLNHRFDWGTLTLGSSRRQYLTEERTEMTLPSGNLSLSTLTLFGAPSQTASWYNNVSLSGSMRWDRRLQEREFQPLDQFNFRSTSQAATTGSARGSVGLGDLSLSGSVQLDRTRFEDVPTGYFPDVGPGSAGGMGMFGAPRYAPVGSAVMPPDVRDEFRSDQTSWSTSLSYRQSLIGATTITPNVSFEGTMVRVDSIPEAQDFVSGPMRMRAGATLRTEVYGFYPGIRGFDAIRHKISPSVGWSYAPEVTPTELQARVFGPRAARTQNRLNITFNQTWEARVRSDDGTDESLPEDPDDDVGEPDEEIDTDPEEPGELQDIEEGVDPFAAAAETTSGDEPRRLPQAEVVTLLALQTSAINYDLVEADSTGRFLDGFTTTTLSNTVRSDFLQGLDLSFAHDLFDDSERAENGARRFSPHLSQLSLGFSVDQASGPVRLLRGLLGLEAAAPREPVDPDPDPVGEQPADQHRGFDSNRIIPGEDDLEQARRSGAGWEARVSYSLRRPRETATAGASLRAQMIQTSLSFDPSSNWSADWSTSYDVEERRFNDHIVRLTRDLHEWEATFGFRQTATGNWAFHFDISLRANRDLRFDYEQRSLDAGTGSTF